MQLDAIRSSQSRGQLHRLLPERARLRWGATLWRNRPARQQTHSHFFGRGSVAAVALATRLACPAEIPREAQSWRVTEKENGGGAGSPIGHRSVALENRPGHRHVTGLVCWQRYRSHGRHEVTTF